MNLAIVMLALFVVIVIVFWFSGKFGGPNKETILKIGDREFKVEVADTVASRARGLSGRESLAEDQGLFFVFSSSSQTGFWMKDMKFPIDIIWIKGDVVVGFSENVEPELGKSMLSLKIYYPPEPVDRVLEINAGLVLKYGIKVGDEIGYSQ